MKIMFSLILTLGVFAAFTSTAQTTLNIDVSLPEKDISPTMWGIFFEDINYSADGGLYAEMIKNRSFEFPQSLQGWKTFGNVNVKNNGPFKRNPHYVTLESASHPHKHTGLENEGFFGISFKKGEEYSFSLYARTSSNGVGNLRVELADPATNSMDAIEASGRIVVNSSQWQKYSVTLSPEKTVERGVLRVFLEKPDSIAIDVEHISLFPVETWKNHKNGLRNDLVQALYNLHPGVFRFPGGCIVEGTEMADRYQWKNTVGPVENRPTIPNRWQYTFPHRLAPDYYQSGGLGFYEYFLLSEEIGAEPLPVLNVGMVCQYQNTEEAHVAIDSLRPFIDDAIDLIEFANGDTTTVWGAVRAEMGHPAPFNLKYLAIGNEQWGKEYASHLEPFVKEIRAKHPEIMIIGSSGPSPEGAKFDSLWDDMTSLKVDLVDEHYYKDENWFLNNVGRYDSYDRKNPKVFAGEYACHVKGREYNNYDGALAEAAFMTGLERNADVVRMATYAPLFANMNSWQWRPDLIWFDNFNVFTTDSYEVQRLFSTNSGTHTLPLTIDKSKDTGIDRDRNIYASAIIDQSTSTIIVKVVNTGDVNKPVVISLDNIDDRAISDIQCTVMTENITDNDSKLNNSSIKTKNLSATDIDKNIDKKRKSRVMTLDCNAKSLTILRFLID